MHDNHPMLLHGAFVPPRAVLDAVDAVIRSVPVVSPETSQAPVPAKGLRARLGRRRDDVVAAVGEAPVMLDHVPLERMQLPIAGFGNLTTHDAHRVIDAIKEAADGWPAPTVQFAGGTALEFPGDWSVWAKLEGDVDALTTAARGVVQCVEGLGFFLDRRMFRPMLSVATVTRETTGPFLESVVGALEEFRGEAWVADICFMRETFVGTRPEMVEYLRVPLAG